VDAFLDITEEDINARRRALAAASAVFPFVVGSSSGEERPNDIPVSKKTIKSEIQSSSPPRKRLSLKRKMKDTLASTPSPSIHKKAKKSPKGYKKQTIEESSSADESDSEKDALTSKPVNIDRKKAEAAKMARKKQTIE